MSMPLEPLSTVARARQLLCRRGLITVTAQFILYRVQVHSTSNEKSGCPFENITHCLLLLRGRVVRKACLHPTLVACTGPLRTKSDASMLLGVPNALYRKQSILNSNARACACAKDIRGSQLVIDHKA